MKKEKATGKIGKEWFDPTCTPIRVKPRLPKR